MSRARLADEAYLLFKVLHVLLAVAWIGAMFFQQILLEPTLQAVSDAARKEISDRIRRPMLRYGNVAGGLTVLTGLGLVSLHPEHGWTDLLESAWGRLVTFGLVGALAILYLMNVAIRPTLKVLERIGSSGGSADASPFGQRLLEKRLLWTGRLIIAIAIFVMAAMVLANAVA